MIVKINGRIYDSDSDLIMLKVSRSEAEVISMSRYAAIPPRMFPDNLVNDEMELFRRQTEEESTK